MSVPALRKKFDIKTKKNVTIAGGATAPMPTPAPMPTASSSSEAPTAALMPQTARGTKRQRDNELDLEDIFYFERTRGNPAARLYKEARRAKRAGIIAERPLVYGPDPPPGGQKRPADAELDVPDRRPPNPGAQKEALRDIARRTLRALYQSRIESKLARNKQEAADIIRRSVATNPIRMDQWDKKRDYEEILEHIRPRRNRLVV